MSKGIQLPVNTLIILIIAVIVLLAVAALFMSGWLSIGEMTTEQAMNACCSKWLIKGCEYGEFDDIEIDRDRDGSTDETCDNIRTEAGYDDVSTQLKNRCACPIV